MAAQSGSSGTTTTEVETKKEQKENTPTLKLCATVPEKKGIKWSEDTIDNEGQGKKSSKCCCIYQKPRMFGESSDEDSDSEDEDKCKGPKDYHKKPKKQGHDDDNCNSCH